MEKCVEDLKLAVSRISDRYYETTGRRQNNETYDQQIEMSFSAELYHHFRTIMDHGDNHYHYTGLILNFDINKQAVGMRPDRDWET
jgi:hypothetical protein